MFDSLLHTGQETKDGRKRAVLTSSMPFRDHFALEEDEPSQIYPHASGKGPQLMLPLTSVAGLVVARVEAELEDGRLHVVPLALFPGRDVLLQPWPGPLPEGRVQPAHILANLLKESLVDEFMARIPCNVATYQFAVHADCPAADLELCGLKAGQPAEAGLHQVLAGRLGVFADAATEGRRGSAHVALLEQGLEDGLVRLACHQRKKLIEPGLGVVILLRGPLTHKVGRIVKQGHLNIVSVSLNIATWSLIIMQVSNNK